jgi:hypothetical protein
MPFSCLFFVPRDEESVVLGRRALSSVPFDDVLFVPCQRIIGVSSCGLSMNACIFVNNLWLKNCYCRRIR